MIFKEVGQTMDRLLVKVAEEHHIDAGVVEKMLHTPHLRKLPKFVIIHYTAVGY